MHHGSLIPNPQSHCAWQLAGRGCGQTGKSQPSKSGVEGAGSQEVGQDMLESGQENPWADRERSDLGKLAEPADDLKLG